MLSTTLYNKVNTLETMDIKIMLESKKGKKKLTETDSSIEKCRAGRDAKFTRTLKLKYFKHERA